MRLRRPGEYQLQAAITALQIQAPDAEATDWAQIAELYGALAALNPSPVVELNRAVAVGLAYGPAAGLALLEPLLGEPALERYQPLHAAHAELLRRAGDAAGAARAYERAIALTANAVERTELERRLRRAALTDAVQIAARAATSCRGRRIGRRLRQGARHVQPTAHRSPGRPDPRRWRALALLCDAFFMVILDSAIVVVGAALDRCRPGFSAQGLQWVISAYLLTFAGLLLLGGRAADLLGDGAGCSCSARLFALASFAGGLAGRLRR